MEIMWCLFVLIMIGVCQGINTNNTDTDTKLSRNKRLMIASERSLWTKGIVPYKFDDTLSKERRQEYTEQVFSVYQKYSCIKFVPWTLKTATEYGLDHINYLIFIHSPQCVSKIGNTRSGGQRISCCSARTCLHELGHAIGLYHEQANPMRDDFVRIQYQNIVPGLSSQFDIKTNTDNHGIYDYDSIMHYALKAWTSNQEPTITFLDPDTKPIPKFANTEQYFYFFKEINEAYQCTNDCTGLTCYNGGYKAIVGGKCKCRCPEGLNPANKCSSLLKEDYDCGKIVNLNNDTRSVTVQSPVIRRNDITSCYWYIKSPPNTRILLNFPIFKIRKQIEECQDEVAVKAYLPGMYGNPYCGNLFKKTIHSSGNILAFSFTQAPTKLTVSTFVARLSFVYENSYCYTLADRGLYYAGTVSFAEDSSRCLPWDKVRDCPHNVFNIKDADKRLEGNFCRNPDNSPSPWCYTSVEGCVRKFCDACNLGVCKDLDVKCMDYKKKHPLYCKTVLHAPSQCRRTCGFCDAYKPLPSVSTITCGPPILPKDAAPMVTNAEYAVGATVKVQCNHSDTEYQHITCLTNGKWTPLRYVCGTCLPGWSNFGSTCFKLHVSMLRQGLAEKFCTTQHPGATLLVENEMNHKFVSRLITNPRGNCVPVWIGLKKSPDGSRFSWPNGIVPKWTNWLNGIVHVYTGEPTNDVDCVSIDSNCVWVKKPCAIKQKFVCRYIRPVPDICANQRNDCAMIIKRNPTMCSVFKHSFALTNCASACGFC